MRFTPVLCPNAVIVGPFCVIRKVCCTLLSPSSKICVLSYPSLHLCTLLSLKALGIRFHQVLQLSVLLVVSVRFYQVLSL